MYPERQVERSSEKLEKCATPTGEAGAFMAKLSRICTITGAGVMLKLNIRRFCLDIRRFCLLMLSLWEQLS